MIMLIFSLLLAPSWCLYVVVGHTPTVTATAHQNATDVHRREDSTTQLSTCGYLTGDPAKPRTADPGFNCRVDAANGVWGFCATTVYSAEDCFFPAVCVDRERCKDGCGVKGNKLRTFTCTGSSSLCSLALLNVGIDQEYTYAACAVTAVVENYFALPTVDASTTKDTSTFTSTVQPPKSQTTKATFTSNTDTSTPSSARTSYPKTSRSFTEAQPAEPSRPVEEADKPHSNTSKAGMIGAIIGGVIGGLALICLSVVAVIYLLRKNRQETLPPAYSDKPPPVKRDIKSFIWSPPQELPATPRRIQSRYELQG